jgi:hypothetical protein
VFRKTIVIGHKARTPSWPLKIFYLVGWRGLLALEEGVPAKIKSQGLEKSRSS